MKMLPWAILSITVFSSCYSYKIYPKEYRKFEYTGEKKLAYVMNPELKKEYAILAHSGIFNLTNDSSSQASIKIMLYPMYRRLSCGQGIIASAFVLGQIPVYFPDKYFYGFKEFSNNDSTLKVYNLQIAQRVWFYDMFNFSKKFKQKAGKSLLNNYYKTNGDAASMEMY
jgi:hypothetical protein